MCEGSDGTGGSRTRKAVVVARRASNAVQSPICLPFQEWRRRGESNSQGVSPRPISNRVQSPICLRPHWVDATVGLEPTVAGVAIRRLSSWLRGDDWKWRRWDSNPRTHECAYRDSSAAPSPLGYTSEKERERRESNPRWPEGSWFTARLGLPTARHSPWMTSEGVEPSVPRGSRF